jgi:hypothetical protein
MNTQSSLPAVLLAAIVGLGYSVLVSVLLAHAI